MDNFKKLAPYTFEEVQKLAWDVWNILVWSVITIIVFFSSDRIEVKVIAFYLAVFTAFGIFSWFNRLGSIRKMYSLEVKGLLNPDWESFLSDNRDDEVDE